MSYPTSPPDFQSKNPSRVARQGLPVNGFITWKLSVCPSTTSTCPGFKSAAFLTIKGLTLSFNAFSPSRASVHLSKLLSLNHSAYLRKVISLGKISCPRSFKMCLVNEIALPIENALGDSRICINILICSSFKVVLYSLRVEYLYCPTSAVQSCYSLIMPASDKVSRLKLCPRF